MKQKQDQMIEFTDLAKQFIDLANTMKNDGKDTNMINAALMSASCTYATYATSGNDGYLKASGVDKVVALYKRNLINLQNIKKNQLNSKDLDK